MRNKKNVLKKRIMFFTMNIIIFSIVILKYLNCKLLPVVMQYGEYQCESIATRLVNYVVSSQLSDDLKEEIVIYSEDEVSSIYFNTSIINSIASNTVMKLQNYFYLLEKGLLDQDDISFLNLGELNNEKNMGIFYEIPLSRIFDNALVGNLGMSIPVSYKMIGDLKGTIVSSIKEYGINNALLEINMIITSKFRIAIPLLTEDKETVSTIPIIIKQIQGDIPSVILGEKIIGEVN